MKRQRNDPLFGLVVTGRSSTWVTANSSAMPVVNQEFEATIANVAIDDAGKITTTIQVNIDVDLNSDEARQLVAEFGRGLEAWRYRHLTGTVGRNGLLRLKPSVNAQDSEYEELAMPTASGVDAAPRVNQRAIVGDRTGNGDDNMETLPMPKVDWPVAGATSR